MPSPSKNIQMNPRTRNQGGGLQKRRTEVGGTLVFDLGEDLHDPYPRSPIGAGSSSDDIREQPPAVTVEPVSDTAQIMALVAASVHAQPALAHQLSRVKVAKDRTTVHFDAETAAAFGRTAWPTR